MKSYNALALEDVQNGYLRIVASKKVVTKVLEKI